MGDSAKPDSATNSGTTSKTTPKTTQAPGQPGGGLPSIDFSTFVLSLSTSALYQMGLVNGPDDRPAAEPDLIMARQTIDTLEMLSAKTRGNLESAERKLIDNLLYELHTRFVALEPG